MRNQTLTLPELSKLCTKSGDRGVVFRKNSSQTSCASNEQLLTMLACESLQFPKDIMMCKRKHQPSKQINSFQELKMFRKDFAKLCPCILSLLDGLFGDRAQSITICDVYME